MYVQACRHWQGGTTLYNWDLWPPVSMVKGQDWPLAIYGQRSNVLNDGQWLQLVSGH